MGRKIWYIARQSDAAHVGNGLGPAGPRPRPRAALLAVLVAVAAPGLGDPAAPARPGLPCWSPGAAPALFAWTDTPAIACRNGAGSAESPGQAARLGSTAAEAMQAPAEIAGPPQITFSGSARFGVAVAF